MTKYKITIEVSYPGESPDPSCLLDAFQDNLETSDMLNPMGEEDFIFEVSVEDLR
jgi:hypothetical protein